MKARDLMSYYGRWSGFGLVLIPYQLALGFTVRWFDGKPHFRLYLGPLKWWSYIGKIHFVQPTE